LPYFSLSLLYTFFKHFDYNTICCIDLLVYSQCHLSNWNSSSLEKRFFMVWITAVFTTKTMLPHFRYSTNVLWENNKWPKPIPNQRFNSLKYEWKQKSPFGFQFLHWSALSTQEKVAHFHHNILPFPTYQYQILSHLGIKYKEK
jgi:hypothetical protein